MSTLLMRLSAPLQAWGAGSKFDRRDTERAPTKSAIIGMVAAALGYRREDDRIKRLGEDLRIGVRIDQPGVLLRDYHTAKSEKSAYVTHRYYVSDAVFLAGLEGEADLLETIQHALGAPFFPLFLGRRSCPPTGQIALGIRRGKTLLQALQEEPVLAAHETRTTKNSPRLRLMLDAQAEEEGYFLRDQPVSFSQSRRVYGFRRVRELLVIPLSGQPSQSEQESPTLHDPFLELED